MSAFAFLGGLGGAYTNIRRGMDQEASRQAWEAEQADLAARRADAAKARAAALQVDEFRAGQRQRLVDEQALQDKTRDELSAIAPAGPVDLNKANPETSQITVDNEGTPSATQLPAVKNRTYDQVLREQAAVLRKNKQSDKAFELEGAADKIAFGRAASRFQQVAAGNADVSTTARQIGEIFDADPNNGGVKAVEDIPGGVRITLQNKDTGATSTREFTGPQARDQLLNAFSAYYSPETWAKLQAERAQHQQKIALERVKGAGVTSLGRGSAAIRDENGNVTISRDPNAVAAEGGAAGGAGGSRSTKPPPTPLDAARGILADIAEKSEDKLTSRQRADAEANVGSVLQHNPGMAPERVARAAYMAAVDPARTTPSVNAATGAIDQVFVDDDGTRVLIKPDFVAPQNAEARGLDKAQLKQAAQALVAKQGDAAYQKRFVEAAFDMKARAALVEQAKASVEQYVRQAIAKAPEQEAQIRQRAQQLLQADLANLDRKLALVATALPRPKAQPAAPRAPAQRLTVGGLPGLRIPGQPGAAETYAAGQRILNQ